MIRIKTFDFLKQLAQNNNREWFNDNKALYEEAREDVIEFTGQVIKELSKLDKDVSPDVDPKKCLMRIYRDIRFSKDKTPYKNNFGIGKMLAKSKTDGIGYYIHIQPGECFAGGGYWMPEASHLKTIRQEVDYNAAELKAIVDAPDFKKLFGDFREQEKLKVMPKGYDPDNENISLIKLKSFAAIHPIKEAELEKADSPKQVAKVLSYITPLNAFLNNALG
jgi:uncharacterized protein (TIGR02453 family)